MKTQMTSDPKFGPTNMNQASVIRFFCVSMAAGLLAACATETPAPANPDTGRNSEYAEVRTITGASVSSRQQVQNPQQLIAELLYEGLQALDQDRLLTPLDNNAHARFQRVLAYDPTNQLALEGLESIVLRYIELADTAILQGLFDQAVLFLDRARFVNESHPAIAAAAARLEAERGSGDLFFDLDARQVAARSEAMQEQLAAIARQAREHQAFFLITAPSDEQARWMFSVMRDAVEGYRLRGNIELAARHSVRLRMPEQQGE